MRIIKLSLQSQLPFLLQIVVAECEKKKDQLWITKDYSVSAQVMVKLTFVYCMLQLIFVFS